MSKILAVIILLLVSLRVHSRLSPIQFFYSKQTNVDILDLYYEYIHSIATEPEPSKTVDRVRNKAECSLLCAVNMEFRCSVILYLQQEQKCILSPSMNRKYINGSVFSKMKPGCPPGFNRTENHCYRMMVGLWNFSEARAQCNSLFAHPLVIEDFHEYNEVITLLKGQKYTFIWTSGIMMSSMYGSLVWKPFRMGNGDEPYLISSKVIWRTGEPNTASELCLGMHIFGLFRYTCSTKQSVICEIDA